MKEYHTRGRAFGTFLYPASLAMDNVGLRISACHEEADADKGGRHTPVHRVLGSEGHSRRMHRHWGGHGRSVVPLSSTRLSQHNLTLT